MSSDVSVRVPFGDLSRQYKAHEPEYKAAIERVLARGWFVLGEEVREFESAYASYVGALHCVACNSGTDAIQLALAAHGIGRGDSVMTLANTCVPTIVGIDGSGATVRLCDVRDDCALMDPASLDAELKSIHARQWCPCIFTGKR